MVTEEAADERNRLRVAIAPQPFSAYLYHPVGSLSSTLIVGKLSNLLPVTRRNLNGIETASGACVCSSYRPMMLFTFPVDIHQIQSKYLEQNKLEHLLPASSCSISSKHPVEAFLPSISLRNIPSEHLFGNSSSISSKHFCWAPLGFEVHHLRSISQPNRSAACWKMKTFEATTLLQWIIEKERRRIRKNESNCFTDRQLNIRLHTVCLKFTGLQFGRNLLAWSLPEFA